MDDVTINDASENDRNVVNVIGRDDDSSIHRHSVASTLIRNSEMSIFGSRRSIFRRSSKLTSNASIMTSINVDESFLSPNNGSNSFLLNIVSLTAVQTFSTAKSVPYDIPRMTFLLTIGFPFNICPIDIAPNNISPNDISPNDIHPYFGSNDVSLISHAMCNQSGIRTQIFF